ncbi:MAG: HIT family protein [Fusobacteriaceae bacterium]|nr:HIT family protein [Fusobacteriaceae bacterium]MBN2839273.1 HIT family protein [Fusobacteriaceae bacterium]
MENECLYCTKNSTLNSLMIEIAKLKISTLYLFKEQTYKGRCIVSFDKHVNELFELSEEEVSLFMKDVLNVAKTLKKVFNADKINYGIYSDKLPHLHFHIVPKYRDDFSWGSTFEMSPSNKKELSDVEYNEMIKLIKDNL